MSAAQEKLRTFNEQFSYAPEISNMDALPAYKGVVVGGMGGSHLAADLIKAARPDLDLHIRSTYTPSLLSGEDAARRLHIAVSYSGNTEEIRSFAHHAHEQGYPLAVITTGGELASFAQEHSLPHIMLPQTDIQPRAAIGLVAQALAAFIRDEKLSEELSILAERFVTTNTYTHGSALAELLGGRIPIIYTSERLRAVAYYWKITLNETGKTPAFFNTFPELNHNELESFSCVDPQYYPCTFIAISDDEDHERILVRMKATKELLEERGFSMNIMKTKGKTLLERVFHQTLLAQRTAIALAESQGYDPEAVPFIEAFKKHIA